jgi:hypothetical protein
VRRAHERTSAHEVGLVGARARRRRCTRAAGLLAWALAAQPLGQGVPFARAQKPTEADDEATRAYKQHMALGVRFFEDKNYVAALAEFEAAYKASPKASPLLNVALCHKALFRYPKALSTLERALAEHGDAMSDKDKRDIEAAIRELRALLAYVRFELTPADATLTVDEEPVPRAELARVALSPGPHRVVVRAEGHATHEETLTVASNDKDKVVRVALAPDKATLVMRATDARTALYLDRQFLGYGEWSGPAPPGSHVVQWARPGEPPESAYAMRVELVAGKRLVVTPGVGGTPIAPTPPAAEVVKPPPASTREVRGPFVLATASLLMPVVHPRGMRAEPNTGGAGGLRVGYRASTPASFDLGFEYGNVGVFGAGTISSYQLESVRVGPNLRLMTPWQTARFYGVVGGGAAYDWLEARPVEGEPWAREGLTAYFHTELGFELDFHGVLAGLAAQALFQSSRGLGVDAYDSDTLVSLGGGLRIGYAWW